MSWFSHTGLGRILKHGWKGITSNGTPVFSEGGMFGSIGQAVDSILKGDVVGNLINGATGSHLTDAQKEEINYETAAQNSLNEQDYYRKIDFYERFESPAAQVEQYKNAGLNPALMYQGGANISASGGVGSGSAGNAGGSAVVGLLSALGGLAGNIMSMKTRQQQIQTEKELGEQRNAIDAFKAERQAQYWDWLSQESHSRTLLNEATIKRVEADTKAREICNYFLPSMQEAELANKQALTREVEEKIKNHQKEREVMDKTLRKMAAEIRVLNSQTDLNGALAKQTLQNVENLKKQFEAIGKSIELTDLEIENYGYNHGKVITDQVGLGAGPLKGNYSKQWIVLPDGRRLEVPSAISPESYPSGYDPFYNLNLP